MPIALLVALLCACCGGNHNAADAAIDMSLIDSRCGANEFFTGEIVDWDSDTPGIGFCGVFNAKVAVASNINTTNPNGRFELCLASAPTTQVTLTPPAGGSQCLAGMPTYSIPGVLVATKAVIDSGGLFSARMISTPRVTTFYQGAGTTYDATKAQLFVHVDGTPRAVSISAASDAAQAWNGTAWAAGATGSNVFFPNVAPAGTTTVSVAGGAIGTGEVPLAAGTISYVTVIAN